MILNKIYVDNLIKTALLEDINYCDVTTDYLIPAEQMGKGKLVAKAEGILCGVEVAARVFELIDSDIKIEILIKDGESVKYGDEIMRLEGRTASLLKGERIALNLIQHMSGIATAANQATLPSRERGLKCPYGTHRQEPVQCRSPRGSVD